MHSVGSRLHVEWLICGVIDVLPIELDELVNYDLFQRLVSQP